MAATHCKFIRRFAQALMFASLTAAGAAQAASPAIPTVEEIVKRLTAPDLSADDLRKRAVAVEGESSAPEAVRSIDLDVNFETGSARLSPDARIILVNVGAALMDPALRETRVRIAGHTDARGSRALNLRLSRLRARSVADYLIRYHGIPTRRLTVEGFGYSQLRDPSDPSSPVNRRVQITNLDS
jgi:outer membrane protein OmpA-like peptidoglycan-associated protein